MPTEQDRRSQRRWSVPAPGSTLTLVRQAGEHWEFEECRLLNVSPRGLRFRTLAPLQQGERLKLLIEPSTPDAVTANVEVRILWVRTAQLGYAEIGAEILAINGTAPPDHGNTKEIKHMTIEAQQDRQMAGQRLEDLLKTEHWLGTFITALLGARDANPMVDFTTAEKLLSAEKEQFDRDLAIARKML
ncbi:MAG: PilZ domain-containing protein, partial [bacterium]|nr:PilZ domain-containing protein [bacterium]